MGKKKDTKKKKEEIGGVISTIHFMMALQQDKLPDNSTLIIVDEDRGMMLGKVKVLPMKEEEIMVKKKYTIRGYKKEEM